MAAASADVHLWMRHAGLMADQVLTGLVDQVAEALRSRGERMTEPRRAVLMALADDEGHSTAEEVVEKVAQSAPSVHRASVYRSLDALVGLGVVQHVHLGKGGTAYHLVAHQGEHVHAQCTVCGQMFDLPTELMASVAGYLQDRWDFTLDPGHVALAGVCTDCAHR